MILTVWNNLPQESLSKLIVLAQNTFVVAGTINSSQSQQLNIDKMLIQCFLNRKTVRNPVVRLINNGRMKERQQLFVTISFYLQVFFNTK